MLQELLSNNFDELVDNADYSVVKVYADWCVPCKNIVGPLLDRASVKKEYSSLSFFALNVDKNSEIVNRYGIMSVPTVLFFRNGELMLDVEGNPNSLVGPITEAQFKEKVSGVYEKKKKGNKAI